MSNDNILEIQTVQISPFRTLMAAMKDILLETNITFTKDGIKIINMDKSHTILVHLFLKSTNFESFKCNMDKIVIGVNMIHLFKLINTIYNIYNVIKKSYITITVPNIGLTIILSPFFNKEVISPSSNLSHNVKFAKAAP